MFRDALLSTTRVIWPAEPGRERTRTRITITADSRLATARAYVATMAFPLEPERRDKFHAALDHLTARVLDPDQRPPQLLHLPRREVVESALRPGLHRVQRALALAERLPFEPREAARMLADARTAGRSPQAEPVRARDVLAREFMPVLPVLHLAMALVASRHPDVVERYPELAPPSMPRTANHLILSDRWPFAALAAAEFWRQALGPMPELIEVRARWLR